MQSVLGCIVSVAQFVVTIVAFIKDKNFDLTSDLGFAGAVISTFPGVVNPAKLAGASSEDLGPALAATVDVAAGIIVWVLDLGIATQPTLSGPLTPHYYFPWIQHGP